MASLRQEKVAKQVQQDLAVIFQQNSKSMFGGAFITVTVVRMTPDLRTAKVYLSFFANSGDDKGEFLEQVRSKTSAIRGKLGNKIGQQVRNVPELYFYLDDSLDRAEEIDNLLKG
ncbi:MAG: 30S ribosome-binding factor RbfA [Bacteroidetes bacterium]|jgi:ribosome-binding factor A|nr:30S ribosome-binding factor RbfA [Bacteroidota bacterium]